MDGNFNNFIEIFRETELLYDGRAITTSINTNPYEAAIIRASLDSAQTGTIYIYGNTAETLSFSSDRYLETTNTFTTVDGITVASLTGNVKLETFNNAREPIKNTEEIITTFGKFVPSENRERLKLMGTEDDYVAVLFLRESVPVKTGDIIYIDRSTDHYVVKESIKKAGLFGFSHIEAKLN